MVEKIFYEEIILECSSKTLSIGDYYPTIFFDVKPEVALKRITGDREVNRLDLESLDFHHKVYVGYQMICDK